MNVECIPLTDFVHGRINAHEGKPILLDDSLAGDLERAGLLRVKLTPRRVDQALSVQGGATIVATEAGKAPAVGEAVPSSSLPAAQASPPTTLHLPKRGPGRPRRNVM